MFKTFWAKLDDFIENGYAQPQKALSFYRIIYASHLLFFEHISHNAWLATLPKYLYIPPSGGISAFFSGFPPANFFHITEFFTCLLAIALLFGYKTRFSSIALALCMMTLSSLHFSLGKIDHSIMYLMVPLIMSFTNWGRYFSLDEKTAHPKNREEHWPVALLAITLGFALFTAGLAKLMGGWLNPNISAVHGTLFNNFHNFNRQLLLAPFFLHIQNSLFWEMQDILTVVCELLFLPMAFFPPAFRVLLLIMSALHLGILLMLNIDFSASLIVYLAFLNWRALMPKITTWGRAISGGFSQWHFVGAVLAYYLLVFNFPVALTASPDNLRLWGIPFRFILAMLLFTLTGALVFLSLSGTPKAALKTTDNGEPVDDREIIFFDGICNLCDAFTRHVVDNDSQRRFRYATLQSPLAYQLLKPAGIDVEALGSMVLLKDGQLYTQSDAALMVLSELDDWHKALRLLFLIPKPIREVGYRLVANNRYRMFGKSDACRIPTPEEQALFLDTSVLAETV